MEKEVIRYLSITKTGVVWLCFWLSFWGGVFIYAYDESDLKK